jgi:hypothetical protein
MDRLVGLTVGASPAIAIEENIPLFGGQARRVPLPPNEGGATRNGSPGPADAGGSAGSTASKSDAAAPAGDAAMAHQTVCRIKEDPATAEAAMVAWGL